MPRHGSNYYTGLLVHARCLLCRDWMPVDAWSGVRWLKAWTRQITIGTRFVHDRTSSITIGTRSATKGPRWVTIGIHWCTVGRRCAQTRARFEYGTGPFEQDRCVLCRDGIPFDSCSGVRWLKPWTRQITIGTRLAHDMDPVDLDWAPLDHGRDPLGHGSSLDLITTRSVGSRSFLFVSCLDTR